jgi:hypothetical protein
VVWCWLRGLATIVLDRHNRRSLRGYLETRLRLGNGLSDVSKDYTSGSCLVSPSWAVGRSLVAGLVVMGGAVARQYTSMQSCLIKVNRNICSGCIQRDHDAILTLLRKPKRLADLFRFTLMR